MALYEALRPVMALWYAYQLSKAGDVPSPRTAPSVEIGDATATRVLLLGNGPCHGWGVVSHTLALAGGVAGELASRNGRGARVDYVGDEVMNVAAAIAWLGDTDLRVYDSVAVVVGVNDAVRLTSLREWERDLRNLLVQIESRTRPGVRVGLAGIQPIRSVPVFDNLLGTVADRHAHHLTRAMRNVADERDGVDFFDLGAPPADRERRFGSPAMYRHWGAIIAEALKPALLGSPRRQIDPAPAEFASQLVAVEPAAGAWDGLEKVIGLAERDDLPELKRITQEALERFGVRIATVSLADGDRLRYVGESGVAMPVSVPLELSHCKEVIDTSTSLVVPRSSRDSRFEGNPLIDASHIEFYAGHPLLSSSGETIGSFCLLHPFAKSLSQKDQDELKGYALRAQAELQKLETGAARPPGGPGSDGAPAQPARS